MSAEFSGCPERSWSSFQQTMNVISNNSSISQHCFSTSISASESFLTSSPVKSLHLMTKFCGYVRTMNYNFLYSGLQYDHCTILSALDNPKRPWPWPRFEPETKYSPLGYQTKGFDYYFFKELSILTLVIKELNDGDAQYYELHFSTGWHLVLDSI